MRRWCRALTMPSEPAASEAGAASWAAAPSPDSARVARVPVGGRALAGPQPLQRRLELDVGGPAAHGAPVLVGPAVHPIYCSQYREPGWLERLGGTSAEGIVDRITNNCYRVDLSGDVNMRELTSRVAR